VASRLFPDSGSRYVLRRNGDQAANGTIVYYVDAAGQNRATVYIDRGTDSPDVADVIVNSETKLDAYGGQLSFRGPVDGTDVLYATVDGGPVFRVAAAPEPRLRVLEDAVEALQPGGSAGLVTAAELDAVAVVAAAAETPQGAQAKADAAVVSAAAAAQVKADAARDAAVTSAAADASAKASAAAAASLPKVPGKNLFDYTTAQANKLWNGVGSSPIDLAGWYASAPIPVTAGQQYSLNNARNYQWFTASMQVVGLYGNNVSEGPVTITAPVGAAFLAFNVALAKRTASQVEAGASVTAFEPYGVQVSRQLVSGRYLTETVAQVDAVQRSAGVSVYRSGDVLLVRGTIDATQDLLLPMHLAYGAETQVAFANDANPNVTLCARSASDAEVWPVIATGTPIHGAVDDNCPINVQWTYIGGNHGYAAGSQVTAAGHGKTTADVGSRWSDGTRTYTLISVLDANTLLFGGQYTVSSGIVTGNATAPAATLTHVAGATSTTSVPITGGVVAAAQIHPSSYGRTVTVELDGRPIVDGKSAGQVLTISESYLVASYKGMIDTAQATVGTPLAGIMAQVPALARVSNTYRITAGQVVVAQRVVVVEKMALSMGVTQAAALQPISGGSRRQFMPGVGTIAGVNWSTVADLAGMSGSANIVPANYTNPLLPPASMTQWVHNAGGVAQYGLTIGVLPVLDGHPTQRLKHTTFQAWFIANGTKKNYPQIVYGRLVNPGESVAGTAYRRYLTPPADATEVTVSDGADTWLIVERPTTTTESRVAVPALLGRRLVPAIPATVATADRVTGDGVTYTVASAPGYGVWRAAPEPAPSETLPGATTQPGVWFVLTQSLATTLTLTGGYQLLYLYPQYLPEATPVDRAAIEVVTLGTGVLRHGVYAHDPTTGAPVLTGPLADYGTIDVTSTGVKESTLSPAVWLPAGWHWYGQVWQGTNTTPPVIRVNAVGLGVPGPMNIGTSSALLNAGRYGYSMAGVSGALGALSGLGMHQLSNPRVAYRRT
jgi:hypothetical protein